MIAARYGSADVVKILLENGADIHAKTNGGELLNISFLLSVYISIYLLSNVLINYHILFLGVSITLL